MKKYKFSVLFLGSSSQVYDTIPEELLQRWDFQFASITNGEFRFHEMERHHVIILDTYSLGLKSLDRVKTALSSQNCAILVMDEYQEKVLIKSILERGATAYLHIDNFTDCLENQIAALMPEEQ